MTGTESAKPLNYDFAVIGGGLFGSYTALYLATKGLRVCLIEREEKLFTKASLVNQARLHSGYHYPRSVATARVAVDNLKRFEREHQGCINNRFRSIYAIDAYQSLTDPIQYERFCSFIKIPLRKIEAKYLQRDRIAAVFETEEASFDPLQIREFYISSLASSDVDVMLGTNVTAVDVSDSSWQIRLSDSATDETHQLRVRGVVNATYSAINEVNEKFGFSALETMHEISEVAFVNSTKLRDTGLTIMDGPFCSIMPYGNTGAHSLTSVIYTHHSQHRANIPDLSDRDRVALATGGFFGELSNFRKMVKQLRQYITECVDLVSLGSLFTVKTKLKSTLIDDARPTEISCWSHSPLYFVVFSGKINSIYEIERIHEYL